MGFFNYYFSLDRKSFKELFTFVSTVQRFKSAWIDQDGHLGTAEAQGQQKAEQGMEMKEPILNYSVSP